MAGTWHAARVSGVRLVLEASRWLAGVWLLWHVPRCRPAPAGREQMAAATSVVIPARDEEANLPRLLASLAAQDPPPAEVIVVDDHSTDTTAEVARRAGATVVTAPPLPDGWTGKTWACWSGAAVAAGTTLAFLDADTEVEPGGGLVRVLAEHQHRGGLVSVAPDHVTARPYERLSAFFNVVAMMGIDAFDPLRDRRPPRGAFGPCLVTGAADYRAVGGHEAVRGDVVEDVALARRYLATGRPVTCLGGRGTVRFRMYPAGPAQLVEGWTKNFAGGAGAARPVTFVLISVWLSGCISAAWCLGASAAGRGALTLPAAGLLYAAYVAQLAWMLARIGRFGRGTALAYPVTLAFFLVIFGRSLVLTHGRGRVTWRGRSIDTRPDRERVPAAPAGRRPAG